MKHHKLTMSFFLIAFACFFLASCATPEQTTAAVAAVGASAAALVQALAPILPPETLAKLQSTAANIDGTVQATALAVGTIADAIAQIKTNVGAQFAEQAKGLQTAVNQLGALPSREEVYLVSGGSGAAGAGVSRLLSHFKHMPKSA